MKTNPFFAGVTLCVVVCVGLCIARDFGPEWTKVKGEYRREVVVPAVHYGFGVANYNVKLEANLIHIAELDDNKGLQVEHVRYGRFEIWKNPDGTAAWHQIRFPNTRYLDLNGDGVFDVMIDHRKPSNSQVFILVEDRFILVKGYSRGWSQEVRTARSADGTEYLFEESNWRIKE